MPAQHQAPSMRAAAWPSAAARLPRPLCLHHRRRPPPSVYCLVDNTSVCTHPAFESFTSSASISALDCRLRALSGPSGGVPVASAEADPASGHGTWVLLAEFMLLRKIQGATPPRPTAVGTPSGFYHHEEPEQTQAPPMASGGRVGVWWAAP